MFKNSLFLIFLQELSCYFILLKIYANISIWVRSADGRTT